MIGVIFDLDQTLLDTSLAEPYRGYGGDWNKVYSLIPQFHIYEGVANALEFLASENIPYVIVTSSPSTYCTKVCTHWNIFCKNAVCYHDYKPNKKPHPAPILLGLDRLKLPAKNVMSFGDRDIDIIASNAAKVESVACMWGASDRNALLNAKPTYTIEHASEITSLVEEFRSKINS